MVKIGLFIWIFLHLNNQLGVGIRVLEELKIGTAQPIGDPAIVPGAGILAVISFEGGNTALELAQIKIGHPAEVPGIVGKGAVGVLLCPSVQPRKRIGY